MCSVASSKYWEAGKLEPRVRFQVNELVGKHVLFLAVLSLFVFNLYVGLLLRAAA